MKGTMENTSQQIERAYVPLRGPEVIDVILAQVRKKLERTGVFPANLTFPRVTWDFSLTLDYHGVVDNHTELNVRDAVGAPSAPEGAVKKTLSFAGGHQDPSAAPDKLRDAADLKVPVVVKGPDGAHHGEIKRPQAYGRGSKKL